MSSYSTGTWKWPYFQVSGREEYLIFIAACLFANNDEHCLARKRETAVFG